MIVNNKQMLSCIRIGKATSLNLVAFEIVVVVKQIRAGQNARALARVERQTPPRLFPRDGQGAQQALASSARTTSIYARLARPLNICGSTATALSALPFIALVLAHFVVIVLSFGPLEQQRAPERMLGKPDHLCRHNLAEQLCDELHSVRPQSARPKIFPLTKDGRSWIIYAAQWWPSSAFDMLWAARPTERPVGHIFGKPIIFPRHTQSWGMDYSYTGQIARAKPLSEAPSQVMQVLSELQHLGSFKRHNQVLQNWYEARPDAKADYIGPHSDDERELVAGAPIVSLSWCTADQSTSSRQPLLPGARSPPGKGHWRRFRVTAKKHVTDAVVPKGGGWFDSGGATLKLHDGDLLVMGGDCQRTHKHEIMKPGKDLAENHGRRINVTFRALQAKAHNVPHKRKLSEAADFETSFDTSAQFQKFVSNLN